MSNINEIRAALAAADLTQEAAARAANISLPTVQRSVRSGQWPKQNRTRKALMRALGVRARKGARP